jgi:thymidine kinase
MAKLYFNYASMNAGKSTILLQSSHNYRERGMATLLFTAAIDDRFGSGQITSRIGLSEAALLFAPGDDLFATISAHHQQTALSCVFVDEAQFLTTAQVKALCDVVDFLDIPVITYGLRSNFQGQLFAGSAAVTGSKASANCRHHPNRRRAKHNQCLYKAIKLVF